MNLEVRPVAINKGEIVKRLMYNNPNAEFVFCAGDDKTDEDMFRALGGVAASRSQSASGASTPARMDPPLSASLTMSKSKRDGTLTPVDLSIQPAAIFSTSVGASTKKTLAVWHVTSPQEILNSMLLLVGSTSNEADVAETDFLQSHL